MGVPSKIAGGSEEESRAGGSSSFTLGNKEKKHNPQSDTSEKRK